MNVDTTLLQNFGSVSPWAHSSNVPFSAPSEISHHPPNIGELESTSLGEFVWTDDTTAGSITAYQQDGAFFPSVEMPPSTSLSNTFDIPLEIPDASMIVELSRNASPAPNFDPECREVKRRSTKPRLRCTHPRCTLTFPRPYELNRHVRNVHDRTVNVPCPVWGCSRVSKPFGRIDKFREHFRKHKPSDNFLCLVEGCSMGPFTLPLLADHLLSQHQQDHSRSSEFYDAMGIISPDVLGGRSLFDVAAKRQEGKDACPMASLGCSFRLSVAASNMSAHIRTHELIDRVRFREDIVGHASFPGVLQSGLVTCLICKEWRSISWLSSFLFAKHIKYSHSKEERQQHGQILSEIFGLLIAKKEPMPRWCSGTMEAIVVEFKEAGIILPTM